MYTSDLVWSSRGLNLVDQSTNRARCSSLERPARSFEPEQLNVLDRAFYWLSVLHDVTFTQTDLDVTTYIRAEHTEEANILQGF